MRRFLRALILLHRTFRSLPAGPRMHVLVRFLTCPFLAIADRVPSGASVLDLGAGHGIFARLAGDRGASRVVAVEPDLRKALPPIPMDRVSFVAGYDDCLRGAFDVVVIVDVLYKIPREEWDALLTRIAARVKPGGLLLLKEHDPTARIKHGWNRLQEWLNSRFLGITLGTAFSYERPIAIRARLEQHGFGDVEAKRIDFGYPHPHILYVARRV
ncbi:MAG TPA: class I SAM-dependent methyltransferase [Thermoanaerobaculia bacterium]|nr:class I SAM-dependent methyltransferase [Thermoanaerobaculia bacterium]